jgi:hypothetical protein
MSTRIASVLDFRHQRRFGVEEQAQALADVLRAPSGCLLCGRALRDTDSRSRLHPVAAPPDADHDVRSLRRGLDAVMHRVLQQRLQHHRRQQRVRRRLVELPRDAHAIAQAQLLDRRVALEQRDLVGEPHEARAFGHQLAKQVREVFERALGTLRVPPHQREHRVQAVEQEMRPDPRLQRLQPRLGERGENRRARSTSGSPAGRA